jgi:putative membrane protein
MTHTNHPRNLLLLTIIWTLGLLASGWQPAERVTWWMEVLPCFVALSIMWPTRRQ